MTCRTARVIPLHSQLATGPLALAAGMLWRQQLTARHARAAGDILDAIDRLALVVRTATVASLKKCAASTYRSVHDGYGIPLPLPQEDMGDVG